MKGITDNEAPLMLAVKTSLKTRCNVYNNIESALLDTVRHYHSFEYTLTR